MCEIVCLCVWVVCESLRGFAHVCTSLYTVQLVCVPKCIYLCVCTVCVCHSSGRQFQKHTMSDIGWLLYNLTGLCTEAGCGMSH